MSLGVDDYLAWAPASMSDGARWLTTASEDLDSSAVALREAADRGTEGQSGHFITQRRDDAAEEVRRIFGLADMMHEAGTVIANAGMDLDSAINRLRQVETELLAEGFVRVEGEHVRDARDSYADATEREDREAKAEDFRERIWEILDEIRAADVRANHALHRIVGRDIRDRTDLGNGNPLVAGISATAEVGAISSAVADLVGERWGQAALDSGRGALLARSLGPVMAGLGFIGAVAARPEDEPLLEAIVAEGIGTIAGAAGFPLGIGTGLAVGGLPGGVVGGAVGLAGGTYTNALASSRVREAFDRAN